MAVPAKLKALFIDDDSREATIQSIRFRKHGIDSEIVTDGKNAYSKYMEFKPEIIILDLEFKNQEMNGVQIFHQLNQDPDFKDKIIVVNSIHMDAKDDLGMQFYTAYFYARKNDPNMVNKLEDNQDLLYIVADLIGRKHGVITKELNDYMERVEEKLKSGKKLNDEGFGGI